MLDSSRAHFFVSDERFLIIAYSVVQSKRKMCSRFVFKASTAPAEKVKLSSLDMHLAFAHYTFLRYSSHY